MEDILRAGFNALSLPLTDEALCRFRQYYEHLTERGAHTNLSALTGERDVATLHFLDCASLLAVVPMQNASIIDVGSGAGFPGLVLKIAEPSISLTLLDSLGKRVDFLSECRELLALDGVTCLCSRAEEAPAHLRESFDLAVSRAVARLPMLCELCLPFVRVGGCFLAMKGPDPGEEISDAASAMEKLGAAVGRVCPISIPGTDVLHSVVVIKKLSPTPRKISKALCQNKKSAALIEFLRGCGLEGI